MAGLAIAIPIGPNNMICIKQTIRLGVPGFLTVALAAGIANVILCCLAASGSLVLVAYLRSYQNILHILGGSVLIVFGVYECIKKESQDVSSTQHDLLAIFFQVLTVALSNPITILGYMSLMIELVDGGAHHLSSVFVVISGLTLASVLWRICLGVLVLRLKSRYVLDYFRYLKVLCPTCFFYFGGSALAKCVNIFRLAV